ncbi:MAG: hypothetical protein Q9163_004730, partial [Psora crenata]
AEMASTTSAAGQTISEVTKEEGSTAAEMQSTLAKQNNLAEAGRTISSKIATDPSSITSEDASLMQSRESRAQGGRQPAKGSLASQAQSLASANETGATAHAAMDASSSSLTGGTRGGLTAAEQSQVDREANYVDQADRVATKLETDPASVSKEDADKMHSREQRVFGTTGKGGLASKAQKQVAGNTGANQLESK